MVKINAREMLRFTTEELYELLTNVGPMTVVLDDGELETTGIMTAFSSHAWVFHRKFPKTPLLKKHHVKGVLKEKRYSADTHLVLLGNALDAAYEAHKGEPDADRDNLALMLCLARDAIYNDSIYRFERFVGSFDIVDYIEILDQPEVIQYKAELNAIEPTEKDIENAYDILDKVMMDRNRMKHNPVVLSYQSRLIRAGQLKQSIGPRGFVTDTDSHQFRYAIKRGYVEGIRDMYGSLIESRSASKSLEFSKENLRGAEYFSRKLQFACMAVERLHAGDCGTTELMPWIVQGKQVDDEGNVLWGGDLPLIAGVHYVDDKGVLHTIREDDTHLIGKHINLRTALGCAHPDPNGICTTCFGELSLQVPAHTNIGHLCCVTMTEPSTQSVLSVKHEDASASIEPIVLSDLDQRFLKTTRDRQSYLLHDRLAKLSPKLVIHHEDAVALSDILAVQRIEDFNISRISEIPTVSIQYVEKGVQQAHSAKVHMGKRKSSLTYAFLNFIRSAGWTYTEAGNYLIDLTGWDYTQPVFTMPPRHFNMADHSKEISSLLQATKDQMQARDKTVTQSAFLDQFFKLVNSKLKVNIAPLAVIIKSLTIISAENRDYRMPKPWTDKGIAVYSELMMSRSMGPLMAYQGHYNALTRPESMVFTNRPDSVFDAMIMPQLYNPGGPYHHLER